MRTRQFKSPQYQADIGDSFDCDLDVWQAIQFISDG